MPDYMEHLHTISKRYIPLETIRKIPEDGKDKSRHFIYKLCFKLASIKSFECELSLNECMNLGKFLNKSERDTKRKWRPIEKALMWGKKLDLIEFRWKFKETEPQNITKDNINTNLFGEIEGKYNNNDNTLNEKYYKYIESVIVKRIYNLNDGQITLPFALEQEEPKKDKKEMKATF